MTWGAGNLEWGGGRKGAVSSRVTWGQGGQDRITPKEGFQVSKRDMEGKARGVKQGDCAITCVVNYICVYNDCLMSECS